MRRFVRVVTPLLALVCAPAALGQPDCCTAIDPVALVRRAVLHGEQDAATHKPMRYELRNRNDRRDLTKEIVETRDGDVARLIARDGKPLDDDANRAELDRLDNLLRHPELQEKRHRAELKDAQRVAHLIHMLPEALLYKADGLVPCGGVQCYRLSFAPSPKFSPPDMEANIFRGVAGEVWIAQGAERIVRIDAHFIDTVDFGLGLLGKVDQGGTALLEDSDIGGGDYELTGLTVNMKGKALLVRSFRVQIAEETSHFAPVPPGIDYRKGIELLLSQ